MSSARFKGINNIQDMLGWQKNSFNTFLGLDSNGISQYTMEQIRAKSAVLGLTDSLTIQATAMAKDADFSAKAATGTLTFGKALDNNIGTTDELVQALKQSGKLSEGSVRELEMAALRGSEAYSNVTARIIRESDDIYDSTIKIGTAATQSTGFINSFKQSFKGVAATLKPMLPLLATVGAALAAYEGFKWLDDKFTLTFGTAQRHLEESSSAYANTASELENLKSQTDEYKSTLESIGSNYDIKFSGKETIDEMITKLRSVDGGISITDDATITKLERENSLLETRKTLLESTASSQQKQAAEDARTSINYTSEKSMDTRVDRNGMDVSKNIDRKDFIREQVSEMEKAQKQINEAKSKIDAGDDDDKWKKQFEQATENLEKYKNAATEKLTELNDEAKNFYDEQTGMVIKGFEKDVKEINELNDLVLNFDLSPKEKQLKQIESFFDGSLKSNSIKDDILNMLETGEVESATDAVHKLGLSLKDLGITGKGKKAVFDKYFDGIIKSAEEAKDAINSIDGSVDGVKAAFESENKDANWNSMADYLKQAEELFKNGKVGTDDFKSAAQFMSPKIIDPDSTKYDADAYVDAWKEAKDKIARYFDAENPLSSATNFTNDLVKNGLALKNGDDITWQFENSAKAAEALGLSVEATEVAMHNLEAYGAEFDDVMFSGEGLKRYESALDGIKSLYDSMDNGDSKDRMKGLIDGWDSELEGYNQDLSALTEDKIVHIEFEYDLASIQSEIDELKSMQDATGGKDAVTNAGIISKNKSYISTAKKGLGLENEGVDLDVRFKPAEDSIDSLYDDLKNVKKGSDEYYAIQGKIENAQEMEKDILDAFSEMHPEITPESDASDITSAWEDFFSQEHHLSIDGELDVDSVESQMESLASGSTIKFTADVDGVDREITAIKNQDGSVSYTADVDGVNVPIEVSEKDGKVTFKADTTEVDAETRKTDGGTRTTKYNANTSGLPTTFTPLTRTVNYVAKVTGAAGIAGSLIQHYTGTLLSPAHADGTAYNMLNLKPAYADGKVSLSKDENALVNELGIQNAPMFIHRKSI